MNRWRQSDPGRSAGEDPVKYSSAEHSTSERLAHGPFGAAGVRWGRCRLLPPELEAARAMVPVADPLTAKRKQGPSAKAMPGVLDSLAHIYGRTDVLAHIGLGPDEAYMLIDKRHPHALFEIMLMSAGPALRSGLHDHSARFGGAVGALAVCFVEHCQDHGLYPTVSWSYDPATVDRESIQGEKRFHAHFVGRSADELARVAALATPAQAYPPPQRRRTVDEAGVLGALLAADCPAGIRMRTLRVVEPLSSPAATAALQLRVCGGWAAFTDPALYADLRRLHGTLRHIYDRIAAACLTGSNGRWQRPTLWSNQMRDVDLPLTPASREALGHYLSALRPSLLHDTAAYEDPATATGRRTSTRWPIWRTPYASASIKTGCMHTRGRTCSPTSAAPAPRSSTRPSSRSAKASVRSATANSLPGRRSSVTTSPASAAIPNSPNQPCTRPLRAHDATRCRLRSSRNGQNYPGHPTRQDARRATSRPRPHPFHRERPPPAGEFRSQTAKFTSTDAWIVDGNYSKLRDITWHRADTLVWLDYKLPLIVWRVTRRNLRRLAHREAAPSGFTWQRAFFSRRSVLSNAVRKWFTNRGKYARYAAEASASGVNILRFRTPRQTEQWLTELEATLGDSTEAPA